MATSAANELVFSIDDHVVNCRRANLEEFLSERHILFQQCSEKEALKFDRVSTLLPYSVFQDFRRL